MDFDMQEQLTLSNLCQGRLEEAFQAAYREVIAQLDEKDKGSISINLSFERITDTQTMMSTGFTLKKSVPGKGAKGIAMITNKGLLTQKPSEPRLKVVSLFDKAEGAE